MANPDKKSVPLEFEQPLAMLAQQIEALEKQLSENQSPDLDQDLSRLQEQYDNLKRSLYGNLRPMPNVRTPEIILNVGMPTGLSSMEIAKGQMIQPW
jgi:hypothetical protein